ncbi:SSI family serine proteinase inhibitor [Streptomyces roseolus]|uniref:SSI family serine proteinase inhibitor n=1 Tax=Streptomyces roseolus TaxID=67358 RepID=UPI0037B587A2
MTALAALTATAAAPSPTEGAHIWLTVTRTTTDGISYTGNLWLDCLGIEDAGHPYRESACTDLDAADGDFDALPGQDTAVCSNDVVRVVTTADGTYEGRSVRWERTYESERDLILATGQVFVFQPHPPRQPAPVGSHRDYAAPRGGRALPTGQERTSPPPRRRPPELPRAGDRPYSGPLPRPLVRVAFTRAATPPPSACGTVPP